MDTNIVHSFENGTKLKFEIQPHLRFNVCTEKSITFIQNEFGKVFMGNLMTFQSSSLTISLKKILVFCHIVIVVVVFDIFVFIGIFRKDPGIKNIVLDAAMFYFRAFYHTSFKKIEITVTGSADFGFIPDNSTTQTPSGSPGVSREA